MLQLFLMRALSVSRYHHFSYLVVSLALLGFGLSGTVLSKFYERFKKHFSAWLFIFHVMFTLTIPLCYIAAQMLPIDIQYILFSNVQLLLTLLYAFLLLIPFFFGALIIGLNLARFPNRQSFVYGGNLIGNGIGSIIALLILFLVPPVELPVKLSIAAALALLLYLTYPTREFFLSNKLLAGALSCFVLIFTVCLQFLPISLPIDPYKDLVRLKRLQEQGSAERITGRIGPLEQIDVYFSRSLHQTLFAGPQTETSAPPQYGLLSDGTLTAPIFSVNSMDDLAILEYLPQSLPYRINPANKALLLDETGGGSIWLASYFSTRSISVVQENPELTELLQTELAKESGAVFNRPNVAVISKNPRQFIESDKGKYDVIQICSAESAASAGGGLGSINENYLLTVESLTSCLNRLNDHGIITITRGIQVPPRDNIKILNMMHQALLDYGIKRPEERVLQARNYLAVNTMISKEPFSPSQIARYLKLCRELSMDVEYFPGIDSAQIRQVNKIPGPAEQNYSYYHQAALEIILDKESGFLGSWVYNLAPPRDDKPYFHNFFKWSSLKRFRESYGIGWLTRLELGYIITAITLIQLLVLAFFLLVLPAVLGRKKHTTGNKQGFTLLYFSFIGFGFMFVEITFMQKFSYFLSSPVYSAAGVIASILIFAGIGSITVKKIPLAPANRVFVSALAVAVLAVLSRFTFPPIQELFIDNGVLIRFITAVLLLAPVSYFMGWFYPSGLMLLTSAAKYETNLAWAVNGFSSVIAAPLAVLLSMHLGFSGVLFIAAALYALIPLSLLFLIENRPAAGS